MTNDDDDDSDGNDDDKDNDDDDNYDKDSNWDDGDVDGNFVDDENEDEDDDDKNVDGECRIKIPYFFITSLWANYKSKDSFNNDKFISPFGSEENNVSAWWKFHHCHKFFGGWGVNCHTLGEPNYQLLRRSRKRKWYPRATTSPKLMIQVRNQVIHQLVLVLPLPRADIRLGLHPYDL
jgi:hypothetical protein